MIISIVVGKKNSNEHLSNSELLPRFESTNTKALCMVIKKEKLIIVNLFSFNV
jgi:hypothetical protein